jgi:predicted nucleotide-binding protein
VAGERDWFGEQYMGWNFDGEHYVIQEKTRKPFERFKIDATRGLLQGLAAFFTTHRWEGTSCHISSLGAKGTLTLDHGVATCRVRFESFPATFLKDKILSDIEATMLDVCGVASSANRNVFIVHGHDEKKRDELKRFLAQLSLQPVVLDEMDDLGMTIIEKFEHCATTCSFAFVLMTPDDRSIGADRAESRWRARQNVIMELGWFMAYLGRDRVIILFRGELEIPSDILGIVCLEFKDNIVEASEKMRNRLRGVRLIS